MKIGTEDLRRAEIVYPTLIKAAREALKFSYCPYSDFPVGAALLAADGRIFTGCNVENASYGATICAERSAIMKAVSEGVREFIAIAVQCEKTPGSWPCGVCRQVISEFGAEIVVVVQNAEGIIQAESISQLLPHMFVFPR